MSPLAFTGAWCEMNKLHVHRQLHFENIYLPPSAIKKSTYRTTMTAALKSIGMRQQNINSKLFPFSLHSKETEEMPGIIKCFISEQVELVFDQVQRQRKKEASYVDR